MKLYLSSITIPTPNDLSELIGKPLSEVRVALIPNAKDYYAGKAWDFTVNKRKMLFESFGLSVTVIDLREYSDASALRETLQSFDLIWAMGGNTFMLRYQMQRSGFEEIIQELLENGVVYGGDSAGALVAGSSLSGINLEVSDEPQFAEAIIEEGMSLVPYIVVPHIDNPEFAEMTVLAKNRPDQDKIILLNDSQAAIFIDGTYTIVEAAIR